MCSVHRGGGGGGDGNAHGLMGMKMMLHALLA